MMSRFAVEVSRISGQNHRDGTRACVRESGHVPSRFPSRDARPECPDLADRLVCVRCGLEGHRSSQCPRMVVEATPVQPDARAHVWAPKRGRPRQTDASAEFPDNLTRAERRVVEAIAVLATNVAVAERLGLSEHTVRGHLVKAREKAGVAHTLQLVVMYLQLPLPATRPSPSKPSLLDAKPLHLYSDGGRHVRSPFSRP